MTTRFRSSRLMPLAATLWGFAAPAHAQTWGLLPAPATDVFLPTRAEYNLDCNGGPVPPCCSEITACGPLFGPTLLAIDLLGWNRWWESLALCKDDLGDCGFMKARGEAVVRLRGLGSSTVLLRWDALGYTKERCDNAPGVYLGDARASIFATVGLSIDGVPPGTPVTVFFRWKQAATNSYSPEGLAEDAPTSVAGGSLTITSGGVPAPLFDTNFDLVGVKGGRFGPDVYGSFTALTGSTVTIDTDVALRATIRNPGAPVPGNQQHRQCSSEWDRETVAWSGEIELSLGSAIPPPPDGWSGGGPGEAEPQPDMLFSVDLGGDAELADPTPEGNEVFDPGDAYLWAGPFMPPPGMDGLIDDAPMFGGFDITPDPGTPFPNDACLSTSPPAPMYFDLDDFDVTDVPLSSMIPPGGEPLPAPIGRFPSMRIFRLENSVISFEDDGPERFTVSFFPGFPYCSVPTGSTGAGAFGLFGRTYGQTANEDEVEQMVFIPGATLPYLVGMTAPGADEATIHVNMAPNPDFTDAPDDDVDGVDIVEGGTSELPGFTYFTTDHEAVGGLPPFPTGVVFERTPGGAVTPVIFPVVHLGLPDGVDIRALEFVFLTEGAAPEALAMIFSVAPDDSGTFGIDESGGLNPALLYYSFLTGSSAELIMTPFDTPIDAFSNYRRPFLADAVVPPGGPCPGDANGDGMVNFADVTTVLANFGATYPITTGAGDADHDGDVDFADVTAVLANWLGPC